MLSMTADQVAFASECYDVEDYIIEHLDEISDKVINGDRLNIVKLRSEIIRAIDFVSENVAFVYKNHRQRVILYGIDKFKELTDF